MTSGLHKGMRPRHLVMMSLGAAIGAGLFVGSGKAVAAAGPAVLVAYLIAGTIVVLTMRMLGEMVAADPNPGAFSHYAGRALGPGAGFAVGWLWWVQEALVVAAEAVAAAAILHGLIGGPPPWVWALVFMVTFTVINLAGVGKFGEFEFWFSLIKIAFVVLFLILGTAFLLGWTSAPSPGLENLAELMPTGWQGVIAALLLVAFAFGGIELVAVAAAETADPERSVTRAIRAIVWRILIFYVGTVTVIVIALPWNDPAVAEGPFTAVLNAAGMPAVASMLGAVIVVALLSSLNANLYGASRMIFSLSERGMAPRSVSRLDGRAVPVIGVICTVIPGFLAVPATYFWGSAVLDNLLSLVGSTLIVTWLATIASEIVLRRRADRDGTPLPLKMWLFPYLSYATLIGVLAILLLGLTVEATRGQIISTTVLVLVLFAIGTVMARRPAAGDQERRASLER
ncbi:amino acid permease [Tsukamurella strandjordii]|uniref:Amino acid permease n=1 Tax=Tsukamurella strandjordii TaxID=147577 RepID=A0AA90N9F3_9ACTN|nr:amino acid permease [Tsukamurella strandjordii]MDP0398237.1 amino acid permease [Tsukamurella strandjordii]